MPPRADVINKDISSIVDPWAGIQIPGFVDILCTNLQKD
jgi:hypothetical protein